MLVELRLENYAVIDNAAVGFASGLNLLTGETGAGKSILIDALALLLGEKASSDVVRSGADRAVLSAVFESEGKAGDAIDKVLEHNGLDGSEDGSLIVRREIAAGGKGRVFVNNQAATVAVLRQLAPHLATIHAQNESILSFDGPARLALLDGFAGSHIEPVAAAYEAWKGIRSRIEELEQGEQDRLRLVDLWIFQKREIEEARLQAGEDERLETEKRVLANAEKIYNAAMQAFDLLYEGERSTSSSMRAAQKQIEELARYEPKFQEALAALETARISVEDVGATVRDYAGGIQASPEHLAEVEDRLASLDRLKRKYGPTLDDVIAFGADVARKLSEVENKDEILRELRAELAKAGTEYLRTARALSKKRQDGACETGETGRGRDQRSGDEVGIPHRNNDSRARRELDDDGNRSGGLHDCNKSRRADAPVGTRSVRRRTVPGDAGAESKCGAERLRQAQGRLSPAKAGGVRAAAQRTMVFDEIDTGIGGRAAEAVGKKLKELARANQVLCVTHLPQIATFADHHYVIEKKAWSGRTRTSIRAVVGEERTEEVARMLSGAKLTDTSRKHAEQMIKANG